MKRTTRDDRRPGTRRLGTEQRRRQLADEAARRFHRYGFHQVSLASVAGAVGVTAPAVYRHFRNKNALLAGAIDNALDVVDAALADARDGSLEALFLNLAGAALERRDLWILLQREMRHLDGDERATVKNRFDAFVTRFSDRVREVRPDLDDEQITLLVTAILGTLSSPSANWVRLSREVYRWVLSATAVAAALTRFPPPAPDTLPPLVPDRGEAPGSRSEELLETAIRLFDEHGYAAVSLDDIGTAIGLTGPSIYYHFATKSELLVTAFTRAAHRLVVDQAENGGAALDDLVRGYIEVGVRQRHLFGVYVTEAINLPPEDRHRISAELSVNVEQWSNALRLRRPELDEAESLVLVHAARGIVNDVVRVGHLHARPQIRAELEALLGAVLDASVPHDGTA
ncbi:TetR family transcriptional regulator [Streptosporangium sp. NPDC049644]|uniref:TetR/AcrR family transcriptional regulator n=1 Tax=Streptosporangium sp. NPDC049644 TaxID=3155507 RepID=UPI003439F07D